MRSFECNKFGGRDVCSLLAKRVLDISETTVLIGRLCQPTFGLSKCRSAYLEGAATRKIFSNSQNIIVCYFVLHLLSTIKP